MRYRNNPPEAPDEHYVRGIAMYRRGRYEQAIEELSQLHGCDDLMAKLARFYEAMSHRELGLGLLRAGNFQRAGEHLRKAMAGMGRDSGLAAYLGAKCAKFKDREAIAATVERVGHMDSKDAWTWRMLAQAQWRTGRRVAAYMTLTAALRRVGDACPLHLQLGMFYAAEDRYDEAVASFERAVQNDCANADAHYYLGLTAAIQHKARQAVRSLQRALELRPGDVVIAHQLALAAKAAGDGGCQVMLHLPETNPAQAESENWQLARYIADEPDFVDAFCSLPVSEADGELFEMLAGVIQMSLAEHPNYADLHYHCSRIFRRLGRIDASVEHAERAVVINPHYVKALICLAELYSESGRMRQAAACCRRAIASGGDWPDVHCMMGRLLDSTGRPARARKHFERAMQLNPNYAGAAKARPALAA